ncbi:MAG TPA: ricin-type beta-trefoil lectin domain protein [Methylocella sp.]|nr:ricin-type beta-trefoil lectin domain protein [Methylocella sp.]
MLRFLLLAGFLFATAISFPSAHAASFTNGFTVCLDDEGGNTANGTPIRSFPCNVTSAQDWSFDGVKIFGPGTIFGQPGKCVEVKGGGTAAGTPIQLSDCTGSGGQQWVYSNNLLVNLGSRQCLDVGLVVNQVATIQPCNGSAGQHWVIR